MTHTCPNCGAEVPCDNRLIGVGRKGNKARGPNHEIIQEALKGLKRWSTVRQVQAYIGVKLDSAALSPEGHKKWQHRGRRSAWNYIAVEGPISDLVGAGKVEMTKLSPGPEWSYRIKAPG